MIATIRTLLDVPADTAWGALKKRDTFLYITFGFLGFTGSKEWPDEFYPEMEIQTRYVFFHLIPAWKHTLHVARIDDRVKELYSNEKGGLARTWNHLISMEPTGDNRCRYTDRIEIDAGIFTGLVWLYAHIFYRYRHKRWKRLIRNL